MAPIGVTKTIPIRVPLKGAAISGYDAVDGSSTRT